MTKRDEAVFAKAFEKMKAKGYFDGLQAKGKTKTNGKAMPVISNFGRKPHRQKISASVSSRNVANKTPPVASKK